MNNETKKLMAEITAYDDAGLIAAKIQIFSESTFLCKGDIEVCKKVLDTMRDIKRPALLM